MSERSPSDIPASPEPIAIIGIGCRFPGAANPEAFWRMLCDGVDAIQEVPAERWDADSFYDPTPGKPGKAVTRWGGFIEQPIGAFDARFFGMSPREASHLDPMQRWLLEVTWEAMEDAGLVPERLAGSRTGVFMGVFTEDTKVLQLSESNRELIGSHTGTGTAMTMASNRLSYWFDLRGPSVSLDTACSSSLVAVHLACQSLWSGESSLALAGGANAMFRPEFTIAESKAGMLSPDGRCKTFDSRANGYVRGEGAGVVVLKRLSAALADGDSIYAVIRGTAANQDGRTPGITVPSSEAQKALVREAFQRAGLPPSQTRYIEAHGTGTPVGDPIEARGLGEVFSEGRAEGEHCLVGSVKTNIGHLEAAAGVAGLVKAALCLKHRQIPPHLHLINPNPNIDFDALRLRVVRELQPWPEGPGPAVAAVNSFGFGGTNAHVVLAEAPARASEAAPAESAPTLVTLSARSGESLRGLASAWRERAVAQNGAALPALAATAALRRSHHGHRLSVVARSSQELADSLGAFLAGEERGGLSSGQLNPQARAELAFVYTGMGPQWWGMGRSLLSAEPVFRRAVEQCDAFLGRWADWSLMKELTAEEAHSRMGETQISQPANFAIQVGLTELLRSWGITPAAIVGHSTGEAASFWAAGVLGLEEACRVVYHRSRLQHRTSGQGKLVAVGLPFEEALAAIDGHAGVSVAAVNSPNSVTLAGDPQVLERVTAPLAARGVFTRFLRVDVPFHSHYMDPLREELLDVLADLKPQRAQVPLYATVTGLRADGPELDNTYWWLNVRDPVRFAMAADRMIQDGYRTFLEVGPHPVLAGSLQECAQKRDTPVRSLPTLKRGGDDVPGMLATVGALYSLGVEPTWSALHASPSQPADLPVYAWDRQIYWEESAAARQDRIGRASHPLLGKRLGSARPTWETRVDKCSPAWLEDHAVQGAVLFPGAGYIEMGLKALREATGRVQGPVELHGLRFDKALFLRDEPTTVQTVVDPDTLSFTVYSRASAMDETWLRHATGSLRAASPRPANPGRLAAIQEAFRSVEVHGRDACYARTRELNFGYGPWFQGLSRVASRGREALARVELEAATSQVLTGYESFPALLDACFQAMLVAPVFGGLEMSTYLPVGIDRLTIHAPLVSRLWVHERVCSLDKESMVNDFEVYDDEGRLLMSIEGFRSRALEVAAGAEALRNQFYELTWREVEPGTRVGHQAAPGTWLLLADETGVAASLAARLEGLGHTVFQVRPGSGFAAHADGRTFQVDPSRPEDFTRLLGALSEKPEALVHLWGLDAPTPGELTAQGLMDAQAPGSLALMHLVQAVEGATWPLPPRLWILTRGARQVSGDTHLVSVAQSPLWGLASSLFQQEHPELAGGVVDLEAVAPADEAERLHTLLCEPPVDFQLALRGGRVWSDRLVPAPHLAEGSLPARLRPDATYLITGGRGGLGLVFARWMIERGARRLVLAGRTPLPERRDWHSVAPDSPAGRQIASVRALEALGASIHPVAMDAGNEAQVRAFLESFRREGWPPIRGVIHAAGVSMPSRFSQLSAAQFLSTVEPKLAGAWNLHRLLADEPLELFVLCSSVASLGFSMGMADYAAGNAFLDAVALARRQLGQHGLAVNWGAWGEVGMASHELVARDFEWRGITPIRPDQGVEALERCLGHDLGQAVVLGVDWPRLMSSNYPTATPPPFLQPITERLAAAQAESGDKGKQGGGEIRSQLAALEDPAERTRALEDFLHATIARSLGLAADQLERKHPLQTFGLDSIIAVELRNQIERGLGVGPTLVELLKGTSVEALAALLLPRLPTKAKEEDELDALAAQLEELPSDELEALLAAEMKETA